MTGTNSDSVIWVAGEATGTDSNGGTAAVPPSAYVVSTSTAAPTDAPTGAPLYLADTDLYFWNASAWIGPFSVAT